jgi:hypothetical protein
MAINHSYFLYIKTGLYIYHVSLMCKGRFSCVVCNISYVDALQLELEHVTINKIDKN